MNTTILKGQFLQGETKKIKRASGMRLALFASEMPRISIIGKINGRVLPKKGAM